MFATSITLFEIYGLKVRIDVSWVFIAIFLAWSLAQGYFPQVYEGLPKSTYWWMGFAGVVGLAVSILLHELAHSIVAIVNGMRIHGITLWLGGGIAELADEPPSPAAEFWMAIAGPAKSLALAGMFYLIAFVIGGDDRFQTLARVIDYLAVVNTFIAVFNLIPAFPMDGGRILRAWLWHSKGDMRTATRTSANLGQNFGLIMIVAGLISVLFGFGLNSLWWVIIGMFIRFAADAALYRTDVTHALQGKSVSDYMAVGPVLVPDDIDARRFRDEWVLRYHHKFYPVTNGTRLRGVIATRHIADLDPDSLALYKVADLMDGVSSRNVISGKASAEYALRRLNETGNSRLLVLQGNTLVGIITLQDLLRVISVRTEINA